jgi:predicted PurR-regulated permease PerM
VTSRSENPRALIRYAIVSLALTIVLMWALYRVRNALLLIYVAALVAIGLGPLVATVERLRVRRRRRRLRLPRWAAILTIYLLLLGSVFGIGVVVLPPLLAQAREFAVEVPSLLARGQQWLVDRGILTQALSVQDAVAKSPFGGGDVVKTVVDTVWGFVGGIFGMLTILIIAFYFMVDSDSLVRAFMRLFPPGERARVADACSRISTKVSAWLAGQLLLATIIGTTAALGLWLLGVPYFYVLALIAAVGEMIPVVGPFLAAIPAVAVALSVSPATALFTAIFFLIQQQVENHVLVPKVMERQVGVSAVVVIVALLIGGSLLGIVGAILAVPTAAILQVLFQELVPEAAAD